MTFKNRQTNPRWQRSACWLLHWGYWLEGAEGSSKIKRQKMLYILWLRGWIPKCVHRYAANCGFMICAPNCIYIKPHKKTKVAVVKLLSRVRLFVTPWAAAHQAPLSFTISRSLLKLKFVESVMLSNHLFFCCPPFPPALNLSQHQALFQWVGASNQVARVLKL